MWVQNITDGGKTLCTECSMAQHEAQIFDDLMRGVIDAAQLAKGDDSPLFTLPRWTLVAE